MTYQGLVEELKLHSYDRIEEYQNSAIPKRINLGFTASKTYNNQKEPISIKHTERVYKIDDNETIFKPSFNKRSKYFIKESLLNLIKNKFCFPIMIFVNGKLKKWSSIEFIISGRDYYVLFKNIGSDEIIDSIETILIPFNVSYTETGEQISNPIFTFDDDGSFNNNGMHSIAIGWKNKTVECIKNNTNVGINRVKYDINKKYILFPFNFIIFKNGLLYDCSVDIAPTNIVTIDNGETNGAEMTALMFFRPANQLISHIKNINNDSFLNTLINKKMDGEELKDYEQKILNKFNLHFNKEKDYTTNIAESLTYIMKYDSSLFNSLYSSISDMNTILFTGKHVNDHVNDKSEFTIIRPHKSDIDTHIIMFVNGELYKHHRFIRYYTNKVIIPIINIQDNDCVEIMMFKNVMNEYIEVIVKSPEDEILIDDLLCNDNMIIMSQDPGKSSNFKYSQDGNQMFELPFTKEIIKMKDCTKCKITFEDPYYYGKKVFIASNHQFKYSGFCATEETIRIPLKGDFRFSLDEERYLVFLNGRKIDSDHYRITTPSLTRPFEDHYLYTDVVLEKDDRLDVFALPNKMMHITTSPTISVEGDLIIDKTKISYNFNKDLYMVFINGKKVIPSDIEDISSTRMKINKDIESTKNLSVVKYIPSEEHVAPLFSSLESEWDNIIASMTDSEIYKMLQISGIDISDLEADIYSLSIPMSSVLHEIMRDHYVADNTIVPSEGVIYDFDESIIEDKDSAGNGIIFTADAQKHTNLEVERITP